MHSPLSTAALLYRPVASPEACHAVTAGFKGISFIEDAIVASSKVAESAV
jgi:hypothetical protein